MRGKLALLPFLGLLAVSAPLGPAQAQFGLGNLIKHAKTAKDINDATREIPQDEEIRMGGDLAGMILGASHLVENPAEQQYVNRVGMWLAMHTSRADLPWKFGIIDTDDVNAFSTPGGYVLITRGLFERMRNESELAGVLAHEISHVVQKHHLHAIQNELKTSAAVDIGGSVAASQAGGIAGFATEAVLKAGKTVYTKGLDKNDEYQADRMGVVIAARSGYSPYGLVGVLQTLSAQQESKGLALMMKTHPNPSDRITQLDTAMGTKLDGVTPVVDDLPTFVALRSPPVPEEVKPAVATKPAGAKPAGAKPAAVKPAAAKPKPRPH